MAGRVVAIVDGSDISPHSIGLCTSPALYYWAAPLNTDFVLFDDFTKCDVASEKTMV